METLLLPSGIKEGTVRQLPKARQLTIIGGAGAGKTKFMDEMVRLNSERAYCLSAVSAPYPEETRNPLPGSIDCQFREKIANQPYMRSDAVSQIDKLTYMIFSDEVENLLKEKDKDHLKFVDKKKQLSHLDRLSMIWKEVFPGCRIVISEGKLMFSTLAGTDLVSADRLSQGEKTVFYYAAAVLYAPKNAVVFIDSPSLFLHPSVLNSLWNSIESLRKDCTFIYNSVDVEFVSSRTMNVSVWVKQYDASRHSWLYEILPPGEVNEDILVDLIGTRKPILFIEGDMSHSLDAKLYPLVFTDYLVRPLGSCDKVIEATRTFNSLKGMHHLESKGIVDRDRRTDSEVDYLRKKDIMVPEVAEIENIFLIEGVIKTMAAYRRKDSLAIFNRIKSRVIKEFKKQYDQQALQHVRYRIKREVECKIDRRFNCITALETHLKSLTVMLNPRKKYYALIHNFKEMISRRDYSCILKVFNHKPILGECEIARELGYRSVNDYIAGVLSVLKDNSEYSGEIREAIKQCFSVE